MENKEFNKPTFEVIEMKEEDIVTASGEQLVNGIALNDWTDGEQW